MSTRLELRVNGVPYETTVEARRTLLEVLRNDFELTGTKNACDVGECGSCTVLLDGQPVKSCITLAVRAQGRSVTTVEGLAAADGTLHPLQQAFVDHGAVQCGFCTPGMILAGAALLEENPRPTDGEVRTAIGGNLCRCTGYRKIVEAILAAAERGAAGAPAARDA